MTQERYRVLENIDTGVSYDCAIKITELNGRFEATAVRLTPVLVEQAAALETETEPPREGGLLRRLGARSRCFCCLDPIPPLRGGAKQSQ